MSKNITIAYFSPGGTTKEIAEIAAAAITADVKHVDLMASTITDDMHFGTDDLLIVAMPVFAGRIPAVCPDMLQKLKSTGATAISIAVYGNRDFDDALLEMSDLLQESGFHVVGAAAFIARHSIFPNVAKDRPDADDKDEIVRFAKACSEKVENSRPPASALEISGNRPYKEAGAMPIRPRGKKKSCTGCNVCVEICPVQAISKTAPTKTDKEKCITCMACVYHCPAKSRGLHTPLYPIAKGQFEKQCAARREPTAIV
ncbi:MAG: EFR1 family ferrodoxin [Suipraeoptans sp.]